MTRAIRDAILSGTLKPGDALVERELAQRLGVSKTPVREALQTLENTGLVTTDGSRGLAVRRVDRNLVSSLYELRLLLEPAAVRISAGLHTEHDLAQAQELLDAGVAHGAKRNFAALSQANRSFHELMYRPCPNELFRPILDGMRDQLGLVASAGWRQEPSWDLEREEHLTILEAVVAGDAARAEEVTRQHIGGALQRLVEPAAGVDVGDVVTEPASNITNIR